MLPRRANRRLRVNRSTAVIPAMQRSLVSIGRSGNFGVGVHSAFEELYPA